MTTMKRFTSTKLGHDCVRYPCGKNGCGKVPGNDHGIADDTWYYVVGDGEVALSLSVRSGKFPESVPREFAVQYGRAKGSFFCLHATFPVDKEDLRLDKSRACDYLDHCYDAGTWSTEAGAFFEAHGKQSFEQPESFWVALEAKFAERAAEAREARVDLEHEQCRRCLGNGTVRREPAGRVVRIEGGRDTWQVLDVALALHGSHTGASDPLAPSDREDAVAFLTERVERWKPSSPARSKRFDDAVREVLKAALEEARS